MNVSNDWWPRFSTVEYEKRYQRIREAMQARGLDCLLIYGTPTYFGTDPGCQNLVYVSSYGPAYHGYALFPRQGEATVIIFVGGHLQNARMLSVIPDVRAGPDIGAVAVQRLRELGYERGKIGIVGNFGWPAVSIPVEHHRLLTEQLPQAQLEVVTDWYEALRLQKSVEEVRFMEQGAAICDRAHEALRAMARPGVSDAALHNEALRVAHSLGGRTPFGHVGSTPMHDPSMHYPSFYPLNRVIQRGDAIMTEIAAGYGGYFGKIWGTLFVGEPTDAYRTMFELAAESYHQLHATIKPGVRGKDLEKALRGRAAEFGYKASSIVGGWSTYNTPPSIGLGFDAEVRDRDFEFRPGLCLSIVGWVTSPDQRMGVWIGDTSIVTEDGIRNLHRYPTDQLDYVTIA
ncbi:MAG: M24 family metallopeptidase [Dehalococcoidia bacterium]